jgi:cystathionine gamma-lyase
MRSSTRIIRSTLAPATPGAPIHTGPVFAAAFHAPGDPSEAAYTYARSHNPTWTELEHVISQIESGPGYEAQTRVFASGIAACTAVFGAVLRPGDLCVYPTNSYFTARHLIQDYFTQMGVELRMVPTADPDQADLYHGAKLVWLESPSNPTMELCDIAALSAAAHRAGALVAVDNTTPTPLGQLPLALGADFSVSSDTKSMTGHSDLLLGHVAVRDPALLAKIDSWRTHTGAALGPMEAWLAHRSIATLPLRLERSCANAQAIAEFLTTRQDVQNVLYPGLPSHPRHDLAKRQMKFFGPVLGFTLNSKQAAETFMTNAQLVTDATSFGSINTSAERRARWGGDAIPEGFIRLSAGCEAIEDLLEDLTQALDSTL